MPNLNPDENLPFLAGRSTDLLTDEALVDLFRASGDQEIIGVLFRRYTHLVLGVCIKYLRDREMARDTAMGVFESLFSSLKKYEVNHFKSWLYTVTRSHCALALRQQKKDPQMIPWEENLMNEVMEKDGFSHLNINDESEERIRRLYKAVGELSPGQQQCLLLFYLEGKSYQQISETTGFFLNEVKSFIQNGKRNLKINLERSYY
ncbi:MAG: sigma-70 family RNA polymerase sigma factor [Bacteroidales bacterium]|nr:sigma-70 family RNA polymerase sigma factor [Bacteroidales bacterium]